MKGLEQYDALGLADLVKRKQVKPIELVEAVIERIEKVNPRINAVVLKEYDLSRQLADMPAQNGLFAGVPFLMKDAGFNYQGTRTTSGCRYFRDFIPAIDSLAVRRYKEAGLILVGKTNVPELAFGGTTEPAIYGPTANPWNTELSVCGSSGGAAAAVATRIVPLVDGSDAAGSIRKPAAFCGIVGLKPSRGRITWAPFKANATYGMACPGPLSLSVRDVAAYLDVVAGAAPGDQYIAPKLERPFLEEVGFDPGRMKIGYTTKNPRGRRVDPECITAVENTAKLLANLGHELVEFEFSLELDKHFFMRLAAANMAASIKIAEKIIGRPPVAADFEQAVWELIQRGHAISGIQIAEDIEKLYQVSRKLAICFEPFDVVMTPTVPCLPFKNGTIKGYEQGLDEFCQGWWHTTDFTQPANITGEPAISLPLYWTDSGLPVGVQFIARYGQEAPLLRLSGQLEKVRPWFNKKPPILTDDEANNRSE